MISSSSPPLERGLDTMVLVYSLLQGHPASQACEQLIRGQAGWFTTALVLFEAKAVLTKVYGVPAALASQKLQDFAAGPTAIVGVESGAVLAALSLADTTKLDLADAILLQVALQLGAGWLATDDQQLAQACNPLGITALSPLGPGLRHQVAAWEAAHLPPKGLARVLRRVHEWLNQAHPPTAHAFWSQTAGGSRLP